MRFWKLALEFLRWDSRIYLGAVAGCLILASSSALADVAHFHNGKSLRGKVSSVAGELIDFKTSFFKTERIQRLTLTNRQDIVEMRNLQKYFGEILYADGMGIDIVTSSGRVHLNRLLVRNIILGAPGQPPVDIPSQSTQGANMLPNGINSTGMPEAQQRVPLQSSTFLFPPPNTPSEDRDAINTDDRVP